MTLDEFRKLPPEEQPAAFEKLTVEDQRAAVTHYDEHVRRWKTHCPTCNFHMTGTLAEIRSFFRRCDGLCKHDNPTK